jgi:membrane-associated phospholipid phosphatase
VEWLNVAACLRSGGMTTRLGSALAEPSVAVHRWLAGALPHELAENGAAAGLLVLGGLLMLTLWLGRSERRVVAGTVLALAATVAAYVLSEGLKLVVQEERPCRGLLADCPAPGDWSFPSNHATLAAALAVGLVLVRPRLGATALAVIVAAAVGVLRVVAGVHYPHDVLAGWALGATVAAVTVLLGQAGLVRYDRRRSPVGHLQAGQD